VVAAGRRADRIGRVHGTGLPRRSGALDSEQRGGGYPLARRPAPEASEELAQ